MPTEKAHGIQIMKMCEAFYNLNFDIELIVPKRLNKIKINPFDYYQVKPVFKITKLPCLDLVKFGKIGFFIQTITFFIFAKIYLMFSARGGSALGGKKYGIIYSREMQAGLFFKNFFLEIHSLPEKATILHKKYWQKAKAIIVLTSFTKNKLIENGIPEDKILIAPDGVDIERFSLSASRKISKFEARKKLNLPQDKKIILYTGHLYEWKGANTLLQAARQFPNEFLFVFVGGTEKDVKKFKSQISNLKNIVVIGHRPHQEIPYWLKVADVLVLPNSAKEKISRFYTSPLKLFEYMTSAVPIVASDLPSIREVLNEQNAVFAEPDNPQALASAIEKVLADNELANKISTQAFADVKNYTWEMRAKNILEFIKNIIWHSNGQIFCVRLL